MTKKRAIPAILTIIALLANPAMAYEELIGTKLPEWQVSDWVNSKSLNLSDLEGSPVLIRFFTGTTCPMCSGSAFSFLSLHEEYGDKGLIVIGLYHHKSWFPFFNHKYIRNLVDRYGFKFPVAVDHHWRTLKAWWLDTGQREMTSVSILLDHEGIIQYIHPGGLLMNGKADYNVLDEEIQKALYKRELSL